jgi:hypothetical protein
MLCSYRWAGIICCSLVETLAKAGVNTAIVDLNGEMAISKVKDCGIHRGKISEYLQMCLRKSLWKRQKKPLTMLLVP